jgi:hypothetical protein
MRLSTVILSASLAGNLILAGALLRPLAPRVPSTALSGDGGPAHVSSSNSTETLSPARAAAASDVTATKTRSWEDAFAGDLRALVERLRAAGFPEREVRSVAMAVVAEKTNRLRTTLRGEREPVPYWRAPPYGLDERDLQRELQQQMEPDLKVVRELSAGDETLQHVSQRMTVAAGRLDHLSEAKQQLLQRIDLDYNELRRQVLTAAGTPGPDSQEKLRLLEEERRRDVQAALTPEEYAEHQLRTGPTANYLRARLDLFQPTEQEFRALHALHEAALAGAVELPANVARNLSPQQVMTALRPQIEALLGPERFADLEQTQIASAQRVNNLLVRLELPLRTGGRIEELRGDIVRRADAVRGDPSLAPAERTARLGELQTEARQRIATTLGGERNLAAYEDIKGWIRDLSPAP